MSNATLDEHQARVERAEKTLSDDLQQLAQHGRRLKRSLGSGKMLLLFGGAAVLGIWAMRASFRRQQRVVVGTALRPQTPSLIGTAVRMAILEATRLAAARLLHRFAGVFDPRKAPELPGPPLARASGIQRSND